jgi:UDP-N-acetylglucosamine:LPS N-acetylglucosamine transferase
MSLALQQAEVVVCLGGAGTVGAALRAGRPLLMLPSQSEQVLTALRVRATGAGLVLGTAEVASQLRPSLNALLARGPDGSPGPHAAAARALARQHTALGADPALAAAQHLVALLPPA